MSRIASAALLAFSAATLALPAAAATETVIYSFSSGTTGRPLDRLMFYGNGRQIGLIGTGSGGPDGRGQVFELTYDRLHQTWGGKSILGFSGPAEPEAGTTEDSAGVVYGTTYYGGSYGKGGVYRLTNSGGKWTSQTIWSFGATGDGFSPNCDLITDSAGALYGTTESGGAHGDGTVFELSQSGGAWVEKILYSFNAISDAESPVAGLYRDSAGNLYGTTEGGGTLGEGAVFELTLSGGVWREKVLHSFTGGTDGIYPEGAVTMSSSGQIFGTASSGGSASNVGIVFALTPFRNGWRETVLHTFTGGADGGYPTAALQWDPTQSILYGTTAEGGGASNGGTVFELTYSGGSWSETVLHSFGSGTDGMFPLGAVIVDSAGNLFGTTNLGGTRDWGTAYEVTP